MGTGLILLFSDPMVDVLSNIGDRLEIPPFYISFVLAPLASNASEFIASYSSRSKTRALPLTPPHAPAWSPTYQAAPAHPRAPP